MSFILFLLKNLIRKNRFKVISIITLIIVAKETPITPNLLTRGINKIILQIEEITVEMKVFLLNS